MYILQDCPGNEVKRNCIQSPMALRVEQAMPTHLVAVDEVGWISYRYLPLFNEKPNYSGLEP